MGKLSNSNRQFLHLRPLKQKIPAYSKYAFTISLGAKEYQKVEMILQQVDQDETAWDRASVLVAQDASPPPPAVDALLKMILFASAVFTTPNYTGLSRELLVARFYVNEAYFATGELRSAISEQDATRALEAWNFGRDSWNSYLNVVNPATVPKVGNKFLPLSNRICN